MDFAKFVSMLAKGGLYFSRVSTLADAHEGSLPIANKSNRNSKSRTPKEIREVQSLFRESIRQWTKVSCWHINDGESEAMWRLYSDSGKAIAIQSTFGRLRRLLHESILCGKVAYVDYATQPIPEDMYIAPFLYKRKSFEHERELRAILTDDWPLKYKRSKSARPPRMVVYDFEAVPPDQGTLVQVELNLLIEKVLVSPLAPDWYLEAVQSVAKQYRLNPPTSRSSLDSAPFF